MTRTRILLAFALAAFLHPCHAQTATVSGEVADTTPDCYRGTAIFLPDAASYQACVDAAAADALSRKASANYSARTNSTFTVTYTPPAPPPDVRTWVRIGVEKTSGGVIQSYTLAAPALVRFGVGQKWVEKAMPAGRFSCSTSTFGDPAPGLVKVCDREEVAPTTPVPTDPPPTPTDPTPQPGAGGVPNPGDFAAFPVVDAITARPGQVIERVRVRSASGSCITIPSGVTDVTIRDSEIGPCGQPGDTGAKGIDILSGASRITVVRNYIHDMATGLYAAGARHPIIFDRNRITNIRGPFPRGQMVQFNGVKSGTAASKVTCNVSDTQGAAYSNVEDHINMFDSGGAGPGALRTEISYNRIRGGSPTSNSGTAIMVGDGASGGNAYVHDNTIVNVRNVGIGVAGGVDIEVANNRVFMDRAVTYTNVGLYVWSQGGGACSGHSVTGNRAWVNSSNGAQNPWWNGGNCGEITMAGNVWPDNSLSAAMFNELPAQCR